jgi:Zn-dependent peptidase ImmA (M78 family)
MVMATARGGVSTSEMRAMSLYFNTMPVIVVNGAYAARGRLFSLLHEYAHLLLHTGGYATPSRTLRQPRQTGSWKAGAMA